MEIKYEAVFGDQSLFDNDIGDSVAAINHGDVVFCFNSYNAFLIEVMKCNDLPLSESPAFAMRRIIRTPTWTVADQKAGKLPEAGAKFFEFGYGEDEVIKITDKAVVALRPGNHGAVSISKSLFFTNGSIKPIESPEEKAARLKYEWAKNANELLFKRCSSTTLTEYLRVIHDAMLSGELSVPGREE